MNHLSRNTSKTVLIAGMLLSFLCVTLFSMIYMAKDNNYDNTIYQYFNISKALYSRLIYLNISKEALISGMNAGSLMFLICNFLLSCSNAPRAGKAAKPNPLPAVSHKPLVFLLICFWVLQAILYCPYVYRFLYCGGFGMNPDPVFFRRFYSIFHTVTVSGNLLILAASLYGMVRAALKKEPIRTLYVIKWSLTIIDSCICILYFYMYSSLPDSFLWISRAVGYTSYRSLRMPGYFSFMRIIPYLIVLFIIILWLSLSHYEKAVRRLNDEEYVFSSIVASSEISTRAFSHYVKNELLGILSETEWMIKDPSRCPEGLERIRSDCQEVYERLNQLQKNSNQIILNKSAKNILDILSLTLEENRELFAQNRIVTRYTPDCAQAVCFCDPRYIREVFQNIFHNAVEALSFVPSDSRMLTIVTVLYESQLMIRISDTGPGISPTVSGRLFEPFVSTKATKCNWGIGLSFSKRIINSHGGKIEASNAPGGGAVFTIYLPVL